MYYKLVGTDVAPCEMMEWAKMFESLDNRIIAKTYFNEGKPNEIEVSTVFLGMDHGFGGGDPLIFETMVFGLEGDEYEYQTRCSTYEQALMHHAQGLKYVLDKTRASLAE